MKTPWYLIAALSLFASHSEAQETESTDTFITLDFLWWKTVLGGMEYATSGIVDAGRTVPLGASTNKGRVQKAASTFEPGIKVGLGVNFEHDGWDLAAQYTRLASLNKTNSISSSPGVGLVNLYSYVPNEQAFLSRASCHWKQTFSVIDLVLGKECLISQSLLLKPLVGLKTALIHEQSKISYLPLDIANPLDPSSLQTAVLLTYRQNMWGLGIRTGLNVRWHITKNWLFYNDFAFTALWSDFHVHQKQNVSETAFGEQTTLFTKETIQTVIPVLEESFGLSYILWWDRSRYRLEFRAGWEEQVWLSFNRYTALGAAGNLSVQGLTLKTALNF